jgi:RNA polymerase sigma-70 factor (ECF subfamily)
MSPKSPAPTTDEKFVRALYAEHGVVLQRYVAGIVRDRQAAEDIVQETMLRAWRRAGPLTRDGRPLRPWLVRTAHNLAIDRLRRISAGREVVGPDAFAGIAGADDMDRALDSLQVEDALRQLSPEHRDVLVETYFRGHSVAEAATRLGIPPGTVKSRSYYALRALRLILEEQGWEPR